MVAVKLHINKIFNIDAAYLYGINLGHCHHCYWIPLFLSVEEKEGILLLLLSAGLKRPCVCGILMLISSMFLLALPPSRFGTVVRSCGKALDGASCCLAYPFSNCDLELHL